MAHALRWYNHINSYGGEKSKFPAGSGKASAQLDQHDRGQLLQPRQLRPHSQEADQAAV